MRRPRVIITAGGTAEPIDDVRVLTNRSTGRFGLALARAFLNLGADVTVIGPPALPRHPDGLPEPARFVPFTTTATLDDALTAEIARGVDVLLMAAAVADYLPTPAPGKLSSDAPALRIDLHRAPKLLPTLRARAGDAATIVGFKLLSNVPADELIAVGARQRATCRLDATIANDLQQLRGDAHPVQLITADGARPIDGHRDEVAATLAAALLPPAPPTSFRPVVGPVNGRVSGWWRVPRAALYRAPTSRELAHDWLEGVTSAHVPAVIRVDNELRLGGAPWDAALVEAALARLADALPGAAPMLWRGEVVGGVRRSDAGAALHTSAPPHGWTEALGLSRPVALTGDLAGWAEAGWLETDDGWLAPWLRSDVVSAASAIVFHRGQVLLGARAGNPGAGVLAAPGGHTVPGELAVDTARRELREETGIALASHPHRVLGAIPTWTGRRPCWRVDAVTIQVASLLRPRETPEMDAAWWSIGDALRAPHLAPGLREVLRRLPRR